MKRYFNVLVILVCAFCYAAPGIGASVEERLELINRLPEQGRAETLE
jgi:hypothetical protein